MTAAGPALSVMLIVPDAEAAITWYKDALGAEELWNLGGVAGLHIAGAPFFLHEDNPANPAETSPDRAGVTSVRIELFVDDPDRVRRAGRSPPGPRRDQRSSITRRRGERTGRAAFTTRSGTTGRSGTVRHSSAQ